MERRRESMDKLGEEDFFTGLDAKDTSRVFVVVETVKKIRDDF